MVPRWHGAGPLQVMYSLPWIGCAPSRRRTDVTMRLRLLTPALILIGPMMSGCGRNIPTPQSAPLNLASTSDPALASEAQRPFAYVAQTCGSSSSCPSPNGLVQMLGGPAITKDIEN